jgi:hypothetical protein
MRYKLFIGLIWVIYFTIIYMVINMKKGEQQRIIDQKRMDSINASIKSIVTKEIHIPDSIKMKP